MADKASYPPLLPPGRHRMTMSETRSLCVDRFPASPNRKQLFDELERLVAFLQSISFQCEVWVNGSFTCDKDTPDDIDLSLSFWAVDAEALDRSVFDDIMNHLPIQLAQVRQLSRASVGFA